MADEPKPPPLTVVPLAAKPDPVRAALDGERKAAEAFKGLAPAYAESMARIAHLRIIEFRAYVAAGFTPQQALELVIGALQAGKTP